VVAAKLIDIGAEGRQRIDRYELVAEIASGGMATVYLARLSGVGGFQRFVAIKRLHPHLAHEKEFVEMFLDEARLAAGIHHPNVVPILEVGASDRGYYLVMEYIEGDTLARLLARAATSGNKLPVSIGLRILLDMLAGLHAAHELRDDVGHPTELVHRDVSPQNVLVGIDGISRITDFGVARAQTRLTSTRTGQLKGKIAYMAPEQAAGRDRVDRRADVFSAGILLWEVLAARRLFKAENEAATLSRVMSEPITRLSSITSDVTPQISAVCMKALERDPDKRFASCAELADALERAATERVATGRDVSLYVSEVLGQEISQQREAVRTWLARSEPSQVAMPGMLARGRGSSMPPSSTVAAAAMSLPNAEGLDVHSHPVLSGVATTYPRVTDSKRVLVAIAACLAALLAGASLVLLWTPAKPTTPAHMTGAAPDSLAPTQGRVGEVPPTGATPQAAKPAEPPGPERTPAPAQAAESSEEKLPSAEELPEEKSSTPPPPPVSNRSRPVIRERRERIQPEPRFRPAPAAAQARPSEPLDKGDKTDKTEKKPDDVYMSNPYR
jgi:serine/threonine-protein kinase